MVSGIFPFLLCTFTLVCNSASFLNSSMHFSFTPSANSEGEAQPARMPNMYQYVSRVTFHPIRTHLFSAMFSSGATFHPPLKKTIGFGSPHCWHVSKKCLTPRFQISNEHFRLVTYSIQLTPVKFNSSIKIPKNSHASHEKKQKLSLSIESWLFNRHPSFKGLL